MKGTVENTKAIPATSGLRSNYKLEKACVKSGQTLLLWCAYIDTCLKTQIFLTKNSDKILLYHNLFLAFGKNIMHTADQQYIANQ
jgi:hypothetical protein